MYMQLSSKSISHHCIDHFQGKDHIVQGQCNYHITPYVSACFTPPLFFPATAKRRFQNLNLGTRNNINSLVNRIMISCIPGLVLVAASSFPRGLGSDNSSWPLTSRQHLLIQHMPKTGGTSFRKMIFQDAARRGKTLQAHDGPAFHDSPQFDAEHPAQVIMGHGVNFHTLSSPVASGHSVRYATMVRSPLAWALSVYLHFHRDVETHIDEKVVEYVQGFFTKCEGLVRSSNGTGCKRLDNQLYAWYSGGATPAMPDKCESVASFFTHSSRLLLVNERYEESIWLLYQMLGWGSRHLSWFTLTLDRTLQYLRPARHPAHHERNRRYHSRVLLARHLRRSARALWIMSTGARAPTAPTTSLVRPRDIPAWAQPLNPTARGADFGFVLKVSFYGIETQTSGT